MNNKLIKFAIMIAVIFGAHAAASSVSAQQIVGGYGDKAVDDKDVVKAAAFAVKKETGKTHTKIVLVKIEKAETQVVAGLNYRVCMIVKVGRKNPVTKTVTAVVYSDLKNRLRLTNWEAGGCKDL